MLDMCVDIDSYNSFFKDLKMFQNRHTETETHSYIKNTNQPNLTVYETSFDLMFDVSFESNDGDTNESNEDCRTLKWDLRNDKN